MEAQPKPVRAILCGEDINERPSPIIIAAAKMHIVTPTKVEPRSPLT